MVINLTGQRFGRLTAVRPTEKRQGTSIVWECKCDCGNAAFVAAGNLQSGNTQSCGCVLKERNAAGRVDLAGMRFGRLIAVRPTEKRQGTSVVWECLCDCGNTTFSSTSNLRSGGVQSCGCLRAERVSEVRRVELTGQRFGWLTAIRATEERQNGQVVWECLCDCGETTFATSNNLQAGRVQSCGCLRAERMREANRLDLTGQRFGKLTAVRPIKQRQGQSIVWECLCDCGNTTFVVSSNLRRARTQSCGCE